MIDHLISMLAPHSCLSCQRPGAVVCSSCIQELYDTRRAICIGCGRASEQGVCEACAPEWPVERAFVFAERSGMVKALIDEFKYNHKRAAYKELAQLAILLLPYKVRASIIPLPTISRHIRQRGYDHAALTARRIAKLSGLRYAPVLRRQGATVQHNASKRDRFIQAANAYIIRTTLDPYELYILFDDIITTGASLRSAAEQLRHAGARRIWILAIARQPLDGER